MALGPLDSSSPKPLVPKLPGLKPNLGKVGDDLNVGGGSTKIEDATKDNPTKTAPPTHTVLIANNVQAYDQSWSELPRNLFSNVGGGTMEVSSIPRVSSLPEGNDIDDLDTGFQIVELDAPSDEEDSGLDEAELALEVSLGMTQLDANERKGTQELASLIGGLDAFRQGQYMKAYQLDPNSFTAYKTIKS